MSATDTQGYCDDGRRWVVLASEHAEDVRRVNAMCLPSVIQNHESSLFFSSCGLDPPYSHQYL